MVPPDRKDRQGDQPASHNPDSLSRALYATGLSNLQELQQLPPEHRRHTVTSPGIRIVPRRDIRELPPNERLSELQRLLYVTILSYEEVVNAKLYTFQDKPKLFNDTGEILDLPAERRLSKFLANILVQELEHPTTYDRGHSWRDDRYTYRSLRHPISSGQRPEGNIAANATFDSTDWTTPQVGLSTSLDEGTIEPDDQLPAIAWHKIDFSCVVLSDGSIAIRFIRKDDLPHINNSAIADVLNIRMGKGYEDDISLVNKDGLDHFSYILGHTTANRTVHPVIDVKDINEKIRRLSEEHDLQAKYISPKRDPEFGFQLRPGSLSSRDGKIVVSFTVDSGPVVAIRDLFQDRSKKLLSSSTPQSGSSQETFYPKFLPFDEDKYLYVPYTFSPGLPNRKITGISLSLNITGGIGSSHKRTDEPDSYLDCIPEMWDPEKVALLSAISNRVNTLFAKQ